MIRKKSLKSFILLFIFGFFLLNCLFFLSLQYPNGFSSEFADRKKTGDYPDPVDIVYTWVNGSDSRLIEQLNYYKSTLYLDKNLESAKDISRSHCPFELCGFNDHFMVSDISDNQSNRNLIIESVSEFLAEALNTSSKVQVTFIASVDRSIQSRRSGLVFQSSVSISSLFSNHSEISVVLSRRSSSTTATMSQIMITVSNDKFGFSVNDHVFVTGLPELRDITIEDKLRREIAAQLPNDTKVIKASATGFLIGLPSGVDPTEFNRTFNCSMVSANARLLRSVLILDMGLVAIMSDLTESRFQDNDELKYSLRSLDKFVDFFRHVYIVTNGQIPAWLNTDNPRVSVVPHWTIFSNRSHLPTFNSAAIEANLHNIPGLAAHFIYLNDDVFFGKKVYLEDFYSASTGYKIQLGWSVPNCVEACPSSWLADGFCDHDCNVADCQWDAGDCIKTQGKPGVVNFQQLSNYSFGHVDNFQSIVSGLSADYCSQGCNTNWLADRYCDQACNVDRCGFDLGDCGDVGLSGLPSVTLHRQSGQIVPVSNGSRAFLVRLQDIIGSQDNVTSATIDDCREMLSSSYAIRYRVIVMVLRDPAFCKDCYSLPDKVVTVNITVSRHNNSVVNIQFLLVLNSHQLTATDAGSDRSSRPTLTTSTFVPVEDDDDTHPPQISSNISFVSRNHSDPPVSIEKLEWERPLEMSHYRLLLQDGLISLAGYRHLVSELWHLSQVKPIKHNISLTALNSDLRIDQLEWGFLPWEKFSKTNETFDKLRSQDDTSSQPNLSTMRHVLDLYAESLRHSNRILSQVYSISQRRVPAHGPHFVSTAIFDEAHKKFHQPWQQTSAHRFRSPNDVQFAFSYFYFLMSENITVPITEVMTSVDTDRSGSLSVNELRSLIVRIHENQTVSFQFIDRILSDINKTCIGPTSSVSGSSDTSISDLTVCFNWTAIYNPKPMSLYPFTIHEDTDLSFIMISTNHEKVLENLDGLRKTPKKFFCLNDNLPNSANPELVQTIRTDVSQFLHFMFPTPSQFERQSDSSPKQRYQQHVIKIVVIVALVLLVLVGVKKMLILSRDCRWSWRLSFRNVRNPERSVSHL